MGELGLTLSRGVPFPLQTQQRTLQPWLRCTNRTSSHSFAHQHCSDWQECSRPCGSSWTSTHIQPRTRGICWICCMSMNIGNIIGLLHIGCQTMPKSFLFLLTLMSSGGFWISKIRPKVVKVKTVTDH